MSNSAYLRHRILKMILEVQLYVSLHTTEPGENGRGEISGGGYQRQVIDPHTAEPLGAGAKNGNVLEFQDLEIADVSHFGIWDAPRGGHFLIGGALILPVRVLDGQTIRWKEGELSLHIN